VFEKINWPQEERPVLPRRGTATGDAAGDGADRGQADDGLGLAGSRS